MQLAQNVWEVYGLRGNPFDVKALSLVAETLLPISKAFVGRSQESKEFRLMTNVLRNPGGACLVIEGEVGIGKTTFVNYHRFLWEHEARDKLFTPVREIGVNADWTVKDFLVNTLDALISKILSLPWGDSLIKKNRIFQEVMILSKVYFRRNLQIEGGVTGLIGMNFGFGQNEIVSVPEVSSTQLLQYLQQMTVEIKKLGYVGIFLHFDNLELIARKETKSVQNLFEEIRDILQTPDIYFVFVGHRGFFSQVIAPLERVRGIFFGYPIFLPPLTSGQVLAAIKRRYQLLSNAKFFTKPVEDEFILYLHKLYHGQMRFIMDAMNTLVPNLSMNKTTTLNVEEARNKLLQITLERLSFLSKKEREILGFVASKETFTNKQLSKHFQMPSANVSRILKALQEANLIYINMRVGKHIHYKISGEMRIIKEVYRQDLSKPASDEDPGVSKNILLIQEVFAGREFTAREYQEIMGLGASTARRYLKKLIEQKKIERLGKTRGVRYRLASMD